MTIMQKYGSKHADVSWLNELADIEQKKMSYLDSHESESVASSLQEEAYQKIKQKYANLGTSSSQEDHFKSHQSQKSLVSQQSRSVLDEPITAKEVVITQESNEVTERATYGHD